MTCEVEYCGKPVCIPSRRCRVHLADLDPDDPQHGPYVKYVSRTLGRPLQPKVAGKLFSLVESRNAHCHVSEVSEGFFGPEVPVQGGLETEKTHEQAREPVHE